MRNGIANPVGSCVGDLLLPNYVWLCKAKLCTSKHHYSNPVTTDPRGETQFLCQTFLA